MGNRIRNAALDWGVRLIIIGVGIAMIAVIALPLMAIEAYRCHARYGAALPGATSSWGPLQSCMVVQADGRRIPAESFREPVR